MLKRILFSLGITIAISSVLGLALSMFGYDFLKMFILAFVLHFIVFGLINYFAGIVMSSRLKHLQTEQLRLLSNQSAEVMCAACKVPAVVPITLGEDTKFICNKCNASNNVVITAEAVLLTTPVANLNPDDIISEKIKLDVHAEV